MCSTSAVHACTTSATKGLCADSGPCLQYIHFLAAAVPPREYAGQLPDLRQLAVDFRLPPEVLFHLYRPVLAAARGSQVAAEDGEIGEAGDSLEPSYAQRMLACCSTCTAMCLQPPEAAR